MAEADTEETEQAQEQCKALTEDGERCSRPAQDGDFCYQHDESDPTVSDSQTVEDEQDEQQETEGAGGSQSQTQSEELGTVDMTAEEKTDPESVDAEADTDHDEIAGVLAVRRTVQSTAGELIGREFDAVSEIAPTDDGWRAVVEVVERRAVPDTQDIIGRYEIELDEDATVHGYRRLDRYRRGDTQAFE
ncbi:MULTISPECIES: gas vesicle protein GvpO, halophile-type [Natronolimnohabitans]|uniref:Gas vesicle synthesis family protein n=1 Tax=Natronolimnohabitans innermongolicus JCM 12255 TaxID=1227499 RepID=L9WQH5_9EURY|nr:MULTISPECIES: gas vesicle protein GvpO [Natronolimnohabitans]ELY51750.1 gas vesicle synthesis family protein [Natronolimnohabitans innermongolicus JCM 12255]MDQ2049617.1 gas vesicle protein GvpO [Natronolimnohabitans sp. A-GB9]